MKEQTINSEMVNNMPIHIITCEEKDILSMFKLGNLRIYLPISAKFFTKLGFKIFLGIKLEKKL